MTFTEKIEKLLASNHIKEVIDEFLKFVNEVPQSKADARSDAGQLRGQIIVLSGRFTELNSKINTNTINPETANQEKASLINSLIQILNQLPSNYPDLNTYLEEKNEDDDWSDAQKKNTIDAYQVYFNKYPNGKYKADTIKLISHLEEVRQKQDEEIKRLALLEKERRENDKLSGETQKQQKMATGQPAMQNTSSVSSSSPANSKKGLFIGLGVVVAAVVIFLLTNNSKKDSVTNDSDNNTTADASSDLYPVIDKYAYYYVQNRENSQILAVVNGLNGGLDSDEWEYVVVVNFTDGTSEDWKKIQLWEDAGTYTMYAKHSDRWFAVDNNGFLNQEKDTASNQAGQLFNTFKFNKYKDGYYQIETLNKGDYVLGLNSATKGSEDGQRVIIMENDRSPQTQWKLIPTGERDE